MLIPLVLVAIFFTVEEKVDVSNNISDVPEIIDRDYILKPQDEFNHFLTCDYFNINESVVATENADYYLKHTIEGDEGKGGSLVVDFRYCSGNYSTTICGHNLDESNKKFSSLAYVWESPLPSIEALYNDGQNTKTYKLWGSYRIGASDFEIAYPQLKNKDDINAYMSILTQKEGWHSNITPLDIDEILILVTCTEPIKHAPHRTVLIFTR